MTSLATRRARWASLGINVTAEATLGCISTSGKPLVCDRCRNGRASVFVEVALADPDEVTGEDDLGDVECLLCSRCLQRVAPCSVEALAVAAGQNLSNVAQELRVLLGPLLRFAGCDDALIASATFIVERPGT